MFAIRGVQLVTTPGLCSRRAPRPAMLPCTPPLSRSYSPPGWFMDTALLSLDLRSIEKLREQELEEARVIHKTGMEPERVLSLLNQRLLLRGIPGRHSAIQYALFDPAGSRMRIVS